MKLLKLPKGTQNLMRSSTSIRDSAHCVMEMVLNSLDADATDIKIDIDWDNWEFKITDNGVGIRYEDLGKLCMRNVTSKCHTKEDLEKVPNLYGYRGESLASIKDLSSEISVTSKTQGSKETYVVIFSQKKTLSPVISFEKIINSGSLFEVKGLFHNSKVRLQTIDPIREMEIIYANIDALSLMNPGVTFSLHSSSSETKIIKNFEGLATTFLKKVGKMSANSIVPFFSSFSCFKISGLISKKGSRNNHKQYIFINKRCVFRTNLHDLFNNILISSINRTYSIKEKESGFEWMGRFTRMLNGYVNHLVYTLNIECPYTEYATYFNQGETYVDIFKWNQFLSCFGLAVSRILNIPIRLEDCSKSAQSDLILLNSPSKQKYTKSCLGNSITIEFNTAKHNYNERSCLIKSESIHKRTSKGILQSPTDTIPLTIPSTSNPDDSEMGAKSVDFQTTPNILENACCIMNSNLTNYESYARIHSQDNYELMNVSEQTNKSQLIKSSENQNYKSAALSKNETSSTESCKRNTENLNLGTQQDLVEASLHQQQKSNERLKLEQDLVKLSGQNYSNQSIQHNKNTNYGKNKPLSKKEMRSSSVNRKRIKENLLKPETKQELAEASLPQEHKINHQLVLTKLSEQNYNYQLIKKKEKTVTFNSETVKSPVLLSRQLASKNEMKNKRTGVQSKSSSGNPHSKAVQRKQNNQFDKQNVGFPLHGNNLIALKPMDKQEEYSDTLNLSKSNFDDETLNASENKNLPHVLNESKHPSPVTNIEKDIDGPDGTLITRATIHQQNVFYPVRKQSYPKRFEFDTETLEYLERVDEQEELPRQNVFHPVCNQNIPKHCEFDADTLQCLEREDGQLDLVKGKSPHQNLGDMKLDHKTGMTYRQFGPIGNRESFLIQPRLPVLPKGGSPVVEKLKSITIPTEKKNTSSCQSSFLKNRFAEYRTHLPSESFVNRKYNPLKMEVIFEKNIFSKLKVLGQVDNKYVATLLEQENGTNILIFDQHAADERRRYEKLLNDYQQKNGDLKRYTLISSMKIPLNSKYKFLLINKYKRHFYKYGLHIQEVTNKWVAVTKIPLCLHSYALDQAQKSLNKKEYNITIQNMLKNLLEEEFNYMVKTNGTFRGISNVMISLIKNEACSKAIKFGQKLEKNEYERLIRNLSDCRMPFQCAHGRPVLVPLIAPRELPMENL